MGGVGRTVDLHRVAKAVAAAIVVGALGLTGFHMTRPVPVPDYSGTTPAPVFPRGLDWINTGGAEVALDDLRGKLVLLDFWTYGCVNCMHVIPDLRRLQQNHGDALVVIGVHSAKFENEGRTANIRMIAERYGRDEPIVNDHEFDIWRAYHVRAWPTMVLIDPEGRVVGKVEGEGHFELLDGVIGAAVTQFERAGVLDRTPLPFAASAHRQSDSFLRFPGKVLADEATGRLFIADTNNHRIIVASLDGEVRMVIGGERGLRDGPAGTAQFNGPQGVALMGADTLFVADTLNNAIRRIDMATGAVSTVAGTGARTYLREDRYPALTTGLNSPWDVVVHRGLLYIAMAGQHQLWTLDLAAGELRAFAGTRREELRDGPRATAGLNQPSGLAVIGDTLYFADSEASAIRAVGLGADGVVETLVGTGLFDFGNRDGVGDEALLQHPLGLTTDGRYLYVADTYNGTVRRLDPRTRALVTLGTRAFDEPGGLSFALGSLYIADTNNHTVKVMPADGGEPTELEFRQ